MILSPLSYIVFEGVAQSRFEEVILTYSDYSDANF